MTQLMLAPARQCARRSGCTNRDERLCLVCPYLFPCPTCHAAPGGICRRPSGHNAASLHIGRVKEADREALRAHRSVVVAELGEAKTRQWETELL